MYVHVYCIKILYNAHKEYVDRLSIEDTYCTEYSSLVLTKIANME